MRKLAALAVTGAIVGGSLMVTTTPAAAATCYGGAKQFVSTGNIYIAPTGTTPPKTTSNCADINIKPTGYGPMGRVKVCFYYSDNTLNYCQASWTSGYAGQWNEVATDVKDGVKFRFLFEDGGFKNFYWAA
ncbi:hypothetical protein [Streptomyces abyssomicinicus]|uniref:hypothetical protein n=1 Tax=Streptomyces abyssomicinicus TaxID=574929 RepID=UPI0015831FD8|nr:hypothetical protein [Streptomyces abyssomicinicus]